MTAPATPVQGSLSAATGRSVGRIGILAGGGRLPLMIAESVLQRGVGVHIVGIEGEADPAIAHHSHTWVNWGQVGRLVAALRREGGSELVIAGSVRRPDLWKVRPDWGFFRSVPQILRMLTGGDDSVLSRVVRFFEAKGFEVRGAHEVAPDLLAGSGPLGTAALDPQGHADARLGFAVRAALGALDAGQAVTVADGEVLAIEGAEGTDAMLERVAELRRRRGEGRRSGVLAKGPKPGQELRVDMPAVGPRTVELAATAGLAGVAVEAGGVLLLDRGEAVGAADALGLAIEGLPRAPIWRPDAAPAATSPTNKLAVDVERGDSHSVPSPLAGEGQGGEDCRTSKVGVPPTPNPSPRRAEGAPSARRGGESGCGWGRAAVSYAADRPSQRPSMQIIGRLRPSRRDVADIEKGLAAVECLSAFDTGHAVVVARAFILAIAAGETILAMLERTRALRQWGIGAKRRVGVLVCRAGKEEGQTADPAALLDRAAAQGLAGVAVTEPPPTLAGLADAAELADRLGLFLMACGERP